MISAAFVDKWLTRPTREPAWGWTHRSTNPTPVTLERANDMVEEETLDVCLCLAALDLATLGDMADHPRLKSKLARWVSRLEEAKND